MDEQETSLLRKITLLFEVYTLILKENPDWNRVHNMLAKHIIDQEGLEITSKDVFENEESWSEGPILLVLAEFLCIGLEISGNNAEISCFMKDKCDCTDTNIIQIDGVGNKFCIVLKSDGIEIEAKPIWSDKFIFYSFTQYDEILSPLSTIIAFPILNIISHLFQVLISKIPRC